MTVNHDNTGSIPVAGAILFCRYKIMKVIYSENYIQKNYTDILENHYRLYIASVIRKNMIKEKFVEFILDVFKPPYLTYEDIDITEDEISEYVQYCINEFIMDNRGLPHDYFNKKELELIGAKVSIEDETLRVTMTF